MSPAEIFKNRDSFVIVNKNYVFNENEGWNQIGAANAVFSRKIHILWKIKIKERDIMIKKKILNI